MARFRVNINFDVEAVDQLDAVKQAHNALLITPNVMWDVWNRDEETPDKSRPVLIDLKDGIESASLDFADAGPGTVEPADTTFSLLSEPALPAKG